MDNVLYCFGFRVEDIQVGLDFDPGQECILLVTDTFVDAYTPLM